MFAETACITCIRTWLNGQKRTVLKRCLFCGCVLLWPYQSSALSSQCSMPSCIVAFHVTCAFDHGLEMKTILAENDEVRFKSFCLEHSCTASGGGAATNMSSSASVSNGSHTAASTNGPHGAGRTDWGAAGDASELQQDPDSISDPGQRSVAHLVSVSPSERAERDQLEREKVSQRKQKLQELEDEFYQLVEPREVAENLGLPLSQVR